jgi:drug/metabolite transporter (DMT)-like permease
MSTRGWLLFIAMGVIWGVPYLMIKVAVEDLDPEVIAGGRLLIGAVLLLPIALYRRGLGPVFRRWPVLLLYTLVEMVGPWLFLGLAESRLNSSTAGLILAVVPLFAAILLTALGHDRLDARRIIGLVVGLGGVVALVGLDLRIDDLLSVGFLVLTAIGYAIGPIIINRRLSDLPPLDVITGSLIMGAVILAPFAIWRWPSGPVSTPAVLSVVGLGVLCTAIAFLLFFILIAEVGPARATVITYINPAVAILLGVLILNEPFTIGTAIGFPLVILGSILATARNRDPKQNARTSEEDPGVPPEAVQEPTAAP